MEITDHCFSKKSSSWLSSRSKELLNEVLPTVVKEQSIGKLEDSAKLDLSVPSSINHISNYLNFHLKPYQKPLKRHLIQKHPLFVLNS